MPHPTGRPSRASEGGADVASRVMTAEGVQEFVEISDPKSGYNSGMTDPSKPGNMDPAPVIDGGQSAFQTPTVNADLPTPAGGWDTPGALV